MENERPRHVGHDRRGSKGAVFSCAKGKPAVFLPRAILSLLRYRSSSGTHETHCFAMVVQLRCGVNIYTASSGSFFLRHTDGMSFPHPQSFPRWGKDVRRTLPPRGRAGWGKSEGGGDGASCSTHPWNSFHPFPKPKSRHIFVEGLAKPSRQRLPSVGYRPCISFPIFYVQCEPRHTPRERHARSR